jgi:hypothetical protein
MATLHGILAELGIENPAMHPEREAPHESEWVIDQLFFPVQGNSYQVTYGKIFFDGAYRHVLKNIRIDGPQPGDWFDLDENKPLDTELHAMAVKGFRPIE